MANLRTKGLQARARASERAGHPGPGPELYLELVPLPADAAREARLLNQLFHLLQERRLGHDLALFICLLGNPRWHVRRGFPPSLGPNPSSGTFKDRADPPQTLKGWLHQKESLQLATNEGKDPDSLLFSSCRTTEAKKPSGWNPGKPPLATKTAPSLCQLYQPSAGKG